VSTPSYSVLLELAEGQLVVVGGWPEPSEAHTWAASLVCTEVPVRVRAVVPCVASADELVTALHGVPCHAEGVLGLGNKSG
jgi:hypothetical protein